MPWRLLFGCVAVGVLSCGCSDDGGGEGGATGTVTQQSENGSAGVPTLCAQWDKVDAELAAETLAARDEIAVLAELLPADYKREAALVYYPGAGDPGPEADAIKAEKPGNGSRPCGSMSAGTRCRSVP